jgi:hypothetical protein
MAENPHGIKLHREYAMPDFWKPAINSADACKAAGIEMSTLKNWVSRNPPVLLLSAKERVAIGDRSEFKFSLARVLQLAITAALVEIGLSPRHAGSMAVAFTDIEEGALPGRPRRKMCELFPRGRTVLVGDGTLAAEIINADTETQLLTFTIARGGAAIVLDLNALVKRVYQAIGVADE